MRDIESNYIDIYQEAISKANVELGLSIFKCKRIQLKNEKILFRKHCLH